MDDPPKKGSPHGPFLSCAAPVARRSSARLRYTPSHSAQNADASIGAGLNTCGRWVHNEHRSGARVMCVHPLPLSRGYVACTARATCMLETPPGTLSTSCTGSRAATMPNSLRGARSARLSLDARTQRLHWCPEPMCGGRFPSRGGMQRGSISEAPSWHERRTP